VCHMCATCVPHVYSNVILAFINIFFFYYFLSLSYILVHVHVIQYVSEDDEPDLAVPLRVANNN